MSALFIGASIDGASRDFVQEGDHLKLLRSREGLCQAERRRNRKVTISFISAYRAFLYNRNKCTKIYFKKVFISYNNLLMLLYLYLLLLLFSLTFLCDAEN